MKDKDYILFDKLNEFINKHYRNHILKGIIFFISTLLCFLIIFSIIEHFTRMSSLLRSVFFWSYIAINIVILIRFIVIPTFKLFRLGKVMSYSEAAKIIGSHFPEIDDKIINIIQLKKLSKIDNELIQASINQKIDGIKKFPFSNIIQFKENKKYIKWMMYPIIIIVILLLSGNKHVITESSSRIIDYSSEYIPPPPFEFTIENVSLKVAENEDFTLSIKVSGSVIPNKVFAEINGNNFRMKKNKIDEFSYQFKNVTKDTPFRLLAEGYYSKFYNLKLIRKPAILNFITKLEFPKYTDLNNQTIENTGDLNVPEGTRIKWILKLNNANYTIFEYLNRVERFEIKNRFLEIDKIAYKAGKYFISSGNDDLISKKRSYTISIIKDEYPEISITTNIDSTNSIIFFEGLISDDYEVSKLSFNYTVEKLGERVVKNQELKVKKLSEERFYHYLKFDSIINPGESLTCFFEVWDNDAINGNKSTKSELIFFKELSQEEIEKERDSKNENIISTFNQALNLNLEIKKELKEFNKSLIDKKNLNWEDKKRANSIIEKQKQLKDLISENIKENEKNNKKNEKLNPSNIEKQKKLEELMKELLDEETQKLLEEFNKMLEEMDKEKIKEALDKIQNKSEDLDKDLDRNLELFKEMAFEQKLEETINKIAEVKEKQKDLKEETEKNKSDMNQLSEKQDQIKKELEEIEENLNDLNEKNNDLENKKDIPDTKEESKKARESMEKSKKSLKNKMKKKSSKEQDKAIESLEKMSEKMNSLQSSCSNSQPVEDMETLRQILENLIVLSFDQEELIEKISSLPKNSTSIVKYIQDQKKLLDDTKIVEDSLLALSKRSIQIESIINKEIHAIHDNVKQSIALLEERKVKQGVAKQQYSMTALNNLALLLSETLKQMQMEIANSKPGSQQCNKPGNSSKPSMKEMLKMQKKMLNEMKKQKGKSGKDGKSKNGKQNSEQFNGELMMMLKQQEQIRSMLQKISNESNSSKEKRELEKLIEEMKDSEKDIINQTINQESVLRQEKILTKMLDYEKAEKEQGEEKKRESVEWNYKTNTKEVDEIEEYIRKKEGEIEIIKRNPIKLNKFYQDKVIKYFNKLSNNK